MLPLVPFSCDFYISVLASVRSSEMHMNFKYFRKFTNFKTWNKF